ncbi:MAG: hypothetical protein WBW71_11405 [Bacteroidota bacterium]
MKKIGHFADFYIMRDSRFNRLAIGIILSAYLVTGALSPQSLLGQALFLKLNSFLPIQNEHSIVLDERPFWTSHKHFVQSTQSSDDYILNAADPLISAATPEWIGEIQAVCIPTPAPLFPPNSLRAPPRS